jgi:hypothetical protein
MRMSVTKCSNWVRPNPASAHSSISNSTPMTDESYGKSVPIPKDQNRGRLSNFSLSLWIPSSDRKLQQAKAEFLRSLSQAPLCPTLKNHPFIMPIWALKVLHSFLTFLKTFCYCGMRHNIATLKYQIILP